MYWLKTPDPSESKTSSFSETVKITVPNDEDQKLPLSKIVSKLKSADRDQVFSTAFDPRHHHSSKARQAYWERLNLYRLEDTKKPTFHKLTPVKEVSSGQRPTLTSQNTRHAVFTR